MEVKSEHPIRQSYAQCEIRSFAPLRGITYQQLQEPDTLPEPMAKHKELALDLRDIIQITQSEMERLNKCSPLIPIDKAEDIISQLTKPSARATILKVPNSDPERPYSIEGFVRVFMDPSDFPDRDIPSDFTKGDFARADRFFVRDLAREYDARGGAVDHLLEATYSLVAPEKKLVVMLLEDSPDLHPDWLLAYKAFMQRGAVKSNFDSFTHSFSTHDGEERVGNFAWYTYPASNAEDLKIAHAYRDKLNLKLKPLRERLAHVAGSVPIVDSNVLCFSNFADGWDLANAYPGSSVTEVRSSDAKRKPERLPNLRTFENGLFSLREELVGKTDVVAVFGALPDIAMYGDRSPKENLREFVKAQAKHLQVGGRIVFRDTCSSDLGAHNVILKASTTEIIDRRFSDQPAAVAVVENIRAINQIKELAPLLSQVRQLAPQDGFDRFLLPAKIAQEVLAKSAYLRDLDSQSKRFYTAYTLQDVIDVLEEEGLSLVYASNETNDYVKEHHYENKLELETLAHTPLTNVPTHMRLTFEKRRNGEPSRFEQVPLSTERDPVYLTRQTYIRAYDQEGGRKKNDVRLQIDRKGRTLDLLPYFYDSEGRVQIICRRFPRPILKSMGPLPYNARYSEYQTEQIGAILGEAELSPQELSAHASDLLVRRAHIPASDIEKVEASNYWYFTTEIANERVDLRFIQTTPHYEAALLSNPKSDFSTDGTRLSIPADQFLRGCQAGGMTDGRIERALYHLLLDSGYEFEPSIATRPKLTETSVAPKLSTVDAAFLIDSATPNFIKSEAVKSEFMQVQSNDYQEIYPDGRTGKTVTREMALPNPSTGFGNAIASVLPILMHNNEVYIGIHRSPDVPASYQHGLGTHFPTSAIFYLPEGLENPTHRIEDFLAESLGAKFGLYGTQIIALGESYLSSPGFLPRAVLPFVQVVEESFRAHPNLHFVKLSEVLARRDSIHSAELLTLVFRLAHVLNELK